MALSPSHPAGPIGNFAVTIGDDTMHVPDAFEGELVPMLAALDWVRVWNAYGRSHYYALAQNL